MDKHLNLVTDIVLKELQNTKGNLESKDLLSYGEEVVLSFIEDVFAKANCNPMKAFILKRDIDHSVHYIEDKIDFIVENKFTSKVCLYDYYIWTTEENEDRIMANKDAYYIAIHEFDILENSDKVKLLFDMDNTSFMLG